VDMLRSTPNLWHRAVEKCDVKWGSQLEMILEGSLNHRYTLSRYNHVMPSPVTLVVHGTNSAVQVHP
jgi:hypothetical protein